MISDVFFAVSAAAQPLRWVFGQELAEEKEEEHLPRYLARETPTHPFANVFRFLAQTFRIWNVVIRDGCEEFFFVLAIEGRLADEHFVEENAVRPPINRFTVRLIQNNLERGRGERGMIWKAPTTWCSSYLGRDVVGRAAESFGRLIVLNVLLAHAEIGDLYVPVLVQQHVVELQVAVDYAAGMQEEQPDCDFGRIKSEGSVGRRERWKTWKVSQWKFMGGKRKYSLTITVNANRTTDDGHVIYITKKRRQTAAGGDEWIERGAFNFGGWGEGIETKGCLSKGLKDDRRGREERGRVNDRQKRGLGAWGGALEYEGRFGRLATSLTNRKDLAVKVLNRSPWNFFSEVPWMLLNVFECFVVFGKCKFKPSKPARSIKFFIHLSVVQTNFTTPRFCNHLQEDSFLFYPSSCQFTSQLLSQFQPPTTVGHKLELSPRQFTSHSPPLHIINLHIPIKAS
jgi:hypothetical protein